MLKSIFSKTTSTKYQVPSTKYQVPSTKYNTNTLLTILIFGLLMVGLHNNAFSQNCSFCCDEITVTSENTDDCCVEFTITNNGHGCTSTYIEFYKKSESASNFNQSDFQGKVEVTVGSSHTYKMCPLLGESSLDYQIKLATASGNPRCVGSPQPDDFVEGCTQHTGSIDLSGCCDCPGYPESQSWFDLKAVLSDDCPDGCMIIPYLNVPDEVTCYKYFTFTNYKTGTTSQKISIGRQHDAKDFKYCISNGDVEYASVMLYKDINDTEGCYLFDEVDCTDTGYPPPVEPCTNDCLDDPWEDPGEQITIPITGCGTNCSVTVNYTHRIACPNDPPGGFQDVQITRIAVPDDGTCTGCDISDIYAQSMKGILAENDMNFEPLIDEDCADTYRIAMGGCWAEWTYSGGGVPGDPTSIQVWTVWEPCEDVPCCIQDLRVCRISATEIAITDITDIYIPEDCEGVQTTQGNLFGQLDCSPACDWNTNLEGAAFVPKYSINSDINFDKMDAVNVTQLSDRLSINIKNNNSNGIQVKIFYLNGNPILSNSYSISKGYSNIDVDLTNINTGVYLYKIEFNTGGISTGKITVVK